MLFNSLPFIFGFLPVIVISYWALRRVSLTAANAAAAFASLFFYGWWSWHSLPILLVSITANFVASSLMVRWRDNAKTFLILGLIGNLFALGWFKYRSFLIGNLNDLGISLSVPHAELPIGISFFTFTQIAFLADTYLKKGREHDPLSYGLFVSYFPHLIAGPILHHAQMIPQFQDGSRRDISKHLAVGLAIFSAGLFKKVALADPIAAYATPVFKAFDSGQILSGLEAWIGALAYTMQLYFDFSAYSDMAVGLSFMLGIRLPINFYSPYQATSIIEFWRRWHMTLSQFLRDYLYIPLGGNRHGKLARYRNLLLTMVLGGLWHGAAWTFIIWGTLHGIYLAANQLFRSSGLKVPALVGWAVTFVCVVIGWVFFRAETVSGAISMLSAMLGNFDEPANLDMARAAAIHIATLTAITLLLPNVYQIFSAYEPAICPAAYDTPSPPPLIFCWKPTFITGFVAGTSLIVSVFFITREVVPTEFLYFQF